MSNKTDYSKGTPINTQSKAQKGLKDKGQSGKKNALK